MERRNFLKLAGSGVAVFLASRFMAAGEPSKSAQVNTVDSGLTDAYLKHLRSTKGIADIRTIRRAGLGSNFLDVVVVSAGFKADQMSEFHGLCESLTKTLLSVEPWKRYQSLVNVHAVFVDDKSVESTRVKVHGYKGEVLGCDEGISVEYGRYAANSAATVIIHNSSFSTASNGMWGVEAINKGDVTVPGALVHELGHGIAGLGDEYIQREGPFNEPPESLDDTVNVTPEPKPELCKWHYWTKSEWPGIFGTLKLPKGVKVTNFEGAGWPTKIYRPEVTCLMRGDRDAFCVVCNETMEANLLRNIDLFKVAEPGTEDIVVWKGESIDFRISAIDLLQNPPEWLKSRLCLYLDGEQVASSDNGSVAFQFRSAKSKPGIHHLGANLNIQSELVRRDFGFLSGSRSWRMKVVSSAKPEIEVKPSVSVSPDGEIDVPVSIKRAKSSLFELKMAHAPDGAVLEKGRFRWKPNGMTGVWRVDFTVLYEQQSVATASMELQVSRRGDIENSLDVVLLSPVDAVTGKEVKIRLEVKAKDARHLLFESVQVLEGVNLNSNTGELSWIPRVAQAGPQHMLFRVKNGFAMRELNVLFWVRRDATPSPVSFCNQYIPQTQKALDELRQSTVVYKRIFETLRLLRDRYASIYNKALVEAKNLYKDLGPALKDNCLQELHLRAWEFAAKPDILKWMREIAREGKSEGAVSLISRLDQIDSYNVSRGK